MTLSQTQIQHIIMYRGMGYTHREIGYKVNTTISTVQNYLQRFKKEAEENGVNETFWPYFSIDSLAKAVYSKNRQK